MAHTGKILVTGSGIDLTLLRPLEEAGNSIVARPKLLSAAELKAELRDAVAYLHGGEEYASGDALSTAESLKVVAFMGIGYESFVDVDAAKERGLRVTWTPARRPDAVAVFTLGQIIYANLGIRNRLDERYPPQWSAAVPMPSELSAQRVGIVGLGSIGSRLAGLLLTIGCEVSYYSRTRKLAETTLDLTYRTLPDLAAWSDILVVLLPENPSTVNIIDTSVFARMKEGSILINTARAALVEPVALGNALRDGTIAVAAIDGHYRDESVNAALMREFGPRLLWTAHVAAHTRQSMAAMVDQAVRSVLRALDNAPDENMAVGQ
ncbi:D-isomer specific 2-hydroxyacid dehydrogenase [Acrocarpospora pleiomorpha]|uniref:D-isomer specific 2-hydroxyacid dehydrogenase n=1 Tax=Acrocarpospora pleiomorpha TaxID=90975 RepID=A0A5M3XFS4_9ACTN|nr:NAD(P)-dependent oxidoreductase [Acrocarpospora pleiomorpha]GES19009.1 D-isomer specific 2-hydroxyacid dehydrogenase [Acrocarpospora pleiomorpha]